MRATLPTPVLVLLALALPALALVVGFPAHPRVLGVLNNAAHAPVFGAFAVVVFQPVARRLPDRSAYLLAFLLAILVGIAVELIQPLFGRESELRDVWTDAFGAAGGLAIVALLRSGRSWLAGTVLAVSAAAAAWPVLEISLAYVERSRQAPALLDISSRFDWVLVSTRGLSLTTVPLPEKWRRPGEPLGIRLRFEPEPWRVIALTEPLEDWRFYRRLVIDMTNPEAQPLPLTLRIHDQTHNGERADRFNRRIVVPAQTRLEFAVPLAEVEMAPADRPMDMSLIAGVMIFSSGRPELAYRQFYLTRIWLE